MLRAILAFTLLIIFYNSGRANHWQLALEHHSGISSYNIDRSALDGLNIDYREIHPFIYATYTAFTAKYDFKDFALYMGLSHFTTGSGTNFSLIAPGEPDVSAKTARFVNHHIGLPIGIAYKLLYREKKVYPFLYAGIEPALNFEPIYRNYPASVEAEYRASDDLNSLFSLYTNLGIGVGYKLSEKFDLEFSFNYLQDVTNFANTSAQQGIFITGTNLIRDYQLSWGVALNYNVKPKQKETAAVFEF